MDTPPRRHHYVPAFHLAQFTVDGRRDSRLFVFDQSQIKSWPSTPDGTAHQRDFYAVDLGSEVHPATFESEVLSELDGKFSEVIRQVVSDKQVPEGDDLNTLLNFVATSMARVPRIRQLVNQVASHVAYEKVRSLISTDEGWKYFLSLSQDDCGPLSKEDERNFRQSILDGAYDMALDNTSHVQQMVVFVDGALPLLAERNWSVGFAAEHSPDLVCSDVPVSVGLNEHFNDSDQIHLAHPQTTVMMPLSRRAILIGAYEQWRKTFQVSELGVLLLNSYTIREAKQVFSAAEDFSYLGDHEKSMDKNDLVQALRSGHYEYSTLKLSLDQWLKNRPIP